MVARAAVLLHDAPSNVVTGTNVVDVSKLGTPGTVTRTAVSDGSTYSVYYDSENDENIVVFGSDDAGSGSWAGTYVPGAPNGVATDDDDHGIETTELVTSSDIKVNQKMRTDLCNVEKEISNAIVRTAARTIIVGHGKGGALATIWMSMLKYKENNPANLGGNDCVPIYDCRPAQSTYNGYPQWKKDRCTYDNNGARYALDLKHPEGLYVITLGGLPAFWHPESSHLATTELGIHAGNSIRVIHANDPVPNLAGMKTNSAIQRPEKMQFYHPMQSTVFRTTTDCLTQQQIYTNNALLNRGRLAGCKLYFNTRNYNLDAGMSSAYNTQGANFVAVPTAYNADHAVSTYNSVFGYILDASFPNGWDQGVAHLDYGNFCVNPAQYGTAACPK